MSGICSAHRGHSRACPQCNALPEYIPKVHDEVVVWDFGMNIPGLIVDEGEKGYKVRIRYSSINTTKWIDPERVWKRG